MKMIKFLAGCLTVVAIVFCSVSFLGDLFKPIYTGDAYNTIDAFYSIPDNSVEVMVYGSSHAWKGFDINEMYENYGIGGWNYGTNWQALNTTYLFFQDSLISQSPKIAIIETFNVTEIRENTTLNGEILLTNRLRSSAAKDAYLEQCFGDNKEQYYAYKYPFIAFHSTWDSLNEWNFRNPSDNCNFIESKGYYGLDNVIETTIPDYLQFEQYDLEQGSVEILDAIVSTCKNNNMELIFYTAPMGAAHKYHFHDAMADYCERNGCAYIDFYEVKDDAGLTGATDFQDEGHLNNSGAKKIADYLGNYLTTHYDLTDFRQMTKEAGNIWAD